MCRNIKLLFHFDPPATDTEIHNAALQFVRKIAGYQKPSQVNQKAFDQAIKEISLAMTELLNSLHTDAPLRKREVEADKARLRNAKRFSTVHTS